jgi:hypothetical protein
MSVEGRPYTISNGERSVHVDGKVVCVLDAPQVGCPVEAGSSRPPGERHLRTGSSSQLK